MYRGLVLRILVSLVSNAWYGVQEKYGYVWLAELLF